MGKTVWDLTTVNDRLSAQGAYLKTKVFVWLLVHIGRLIGPGPYLKNEKQKQEVSSK